MALIYMDNAATTKMSPTVLEAMMPYMTDKYGNPSSIYNLASQSRDAIENAREIIANSIGAEPEEIFFTSGGTESDNWVISKAQEFARDKNYWIVSTEIEHHAILNSLKYSNVPYSLLPVNKHGFVQTQDLLKEMSYGSSTLVSVMFANNEIGTIQSIKNISRMIPRTQGFVHTDAVQAYGHIPINVKNLNLDLMSASAHKLNGPKGVGFLYIKKRYIKDFIPFIHGGKQEHGFRAGTENVAGIVGFGQAAKEAMENMDERRDYVTKLRNHLIERVLNEIPRCQLNGDPTRRLPGNANFSFDGVDGEAVVILLNEQDICASTGSACSSGNSDPSHVLKAIGLSDDMAYGSLRLTLDHNNTMEEVDIVVDALKQIIAQLRSMNL